MFYLYMFPYWLVPKAVWILAVSSKKGATANCTPTSGCGWSYRAVSRWARATVLPGDRAEPDVFLSQLIVRY